MAPGHGLCAGKSHNLGLGRAMPLSDTIGSFRRKTSSRMAEIPRACGGKPSDDIDRLKRLGPRSRQFLPTRPDAL